MAPITPLQPASPHVPAWKRLGLKLKSGPENQESLAPIASQHLPNHASTPELNTNSKRPHDQSSYPDNTPPAKKAKKSTKNSSQPLPEAQDSPSLKKRKSVTFTPETKRDDGDSIKQLFNAWVTQQKEEDPSFGATRSNEAFKTPEPPQVVEQVEDSTLTESEKRVKRVKKPEKAKKEKGSNKPSESPVSQRLSPALQYLRQYHDSRDTWKFNKNHQILIIKHVFDIGKIPLNYNEVLHHYITGMQGNVRTRLRDEALKIKIQDQEAGAAGFPSDMSDREKKQQEYNAAMSEYVANVTMRDASPAMGYEEGVALSLSDSAMRERLGKRMRAERIIAQLGRENQSSATTNGADGDSQKRLRLNDGSAQKTARRRKQRTAALDDDTSSSSSSIDDDSSTDSESDSDDSSDSEESARGAAPNEGETSSSSSSSSSSGSDSESEGSEDESEDE